MKRSRQTAVLSGWVLGGALLTACSSSSNTTVSPTPSTAPAPSVTASPSETASATPTPNPSVTAKAAVPVKGPKSATCVNGWTDTLLSTDDFYKQALAALQQSQGAGEYVLKTVRYFAGPLSSGGIGAIYYLQVGAPFDARVLLVSTGGPSQAAAALISTSGWKAGDWKGFRGQTAAVAYPPLPGRWSGPTYDPVTGGLLTPSVAGCLAGT